MGAQHCASEACEVFDYIKNDKIEVPEMESGDQSGSEGEKQSEKQSGAEGISQAHALFPALSINGI
jgi:hypothetical protein